MAPRKYTLGKRTKAVAETRQRIIDAAVAIYQEKGISNTNMQDVAREADVAPGTVLNHFPTPDDLVAAVLVHLTAALRVPGEEIFAGLPTVAQRVTRLVRELAAFYERSEPWYRIHERDKDRVKALTEGEARFYGTIDALVRAALNPLDTTERTIVIVMALIYPGVFGVLQAKGLSMETAADIVIELLLTWLNRIVKEKEGNHG
jgi:AcrR family transcriptional regulator